MLERTSAECKKLIIQTGVVIGIFVIGFVCALIYNLEDVAFSVNLLWYAVMMGTVFGGAPAMLVALFLKLLNGGRWNAFGAFLISGVGLLVILLIFDFIAGIISNFGISKNLIGVIAVLCFFVAEVVQLLNTIKEYKVAVEQEANPEIYSSNQDENEWLLK